MWEKQDRNTLSHKTAGKVRVEVGQIKEKACRSSNIIISCELMANVDRKPQWVAKYEYIHCR